MLVYSLFRGASECNKEIATCTLFEYLTLSDASFLKTQWVCFNASFSFVVGMNSRVPNEKDLRVPILGQIPMSCRCCLGFTYNDKLSTRTRSDPLAGCEHQHRVPIGSLELCSQWNSCPVPLYITSCNQTSKADEWDDSCTLVVLPFGKKSVGERCDAGTEALSRNPFHVRSRVQSASVVFSNCGVNKCAHATDSLNV